MKLKTIIAEDEFLAREELQYLLAQEADIEMLPHAANGMELMETVRSCGADLVFLDIEMPGMDGLQAARELEGLHRRPAVVFTTAYDRYAVEAFRLQAADYLLKPYDPDRLKVTLERIREHLRLRSLKPTHEAGDAPALSRRPAASPAVKSKLLVDDGSKLHVVNPADILYMVKEEKLTRLHMRSGATHATRQTLQELEDKLKEHPFFRCHRSYLVNVDYIREMEPWFNGAYNAVLGDGAKRLQVPVSKTAAKDMIRLLEGQP